MIKIICFIIVLVISISLTSWIKIKINDWHQIKKIRKNNVK